jgi:sulfur-oxidizing protein SoxY
MSPIKPDVSRRDVMAGAAALAVAPVVASPASAAPEDMQSEISKLIGTRGVKPGRVKVELPELTENGNSSSLTVTVESPMTAADHVRAVHLFSEKNPVAYIARLGLGPRAGRAKVATTIRIADSQTITVVAEMSDGSFWSGTADTQVTTPACIDDSRL